MKNHRDYILSSGADTGVLVGGFLEVIVALAGIGTAVTLYPVVKRQNEGVALGFVTSRILEAAMIFTGVVSLLSLVTLRQDLGGAAGADAASLVTTGASHVATYNWTFLLGQSLMPAHQRPAAGHPDVPVRARATRHPRDRTHRSPPAPRRRHRHAASAASSGLRVARRSPPLPIACWEFSLGVWLVVKGFKPSPITADMAAASTPPAYQDVAV